ncbi:MAG: NOB1 family endonuclease [Thaumarchaeota archaeon]|nr:NOB1 family endonuclease [Nitrososphaerota archaeon]
MARKAVILDSAAFILGFTQVSEGVAITSSKILEEARYGGAEYRALASREGGMIEVMDPKPEYVERIRKAALEMGEERLSEADLSVLALALQLKDEKWEVCIITSDYSVQNLASRLKIEVKPILHKGIKEIISWETYCSVCKWAGEGKPGDPCPRCGHTLKRRPRRRS